MWPRDAEAKQNQSEEEQLSKYSFCGSWGLFWSSQQQGLTNHANGGIEASSDDLRIGVHVSHGVSGQMRYGSRPWSWPMSHTHSLLRVLLSMVGRTKKQAVYTHWDNHDNIWSPCSVWDHDTWLAYPLHSWYVRLTHGLTTTHTPFQTNVSSHCWLWTKGSQLGIFISTASGKAIYYLDQRQWRHRPQATTDDFR